MPETDRFHTNSSCPSTWETELSSTLLDELRNYITTDKTKPATPEKQAGNGQPNLKLEREPEICKVIPKLESYSPHSPANTERPKQTHGLLMELTEFLLPRANKGLTMTKSDSSIIPLLKQTDAVPQERPNSTDFLYVKVLPLLLENEERRRRSEHIPVSKPSILLSGRPGEKGQPEPASTQVSAEQPGLIDKLWPSNWHRYKKVAQQRSGEKLEARVDPEAELETQNQRPQVNA